MQIVRDSIYELWKKLVNAVQAQYFADNISGETLNEKQLEYIEKKIWDFMTACSVPDRLPNRQGRAFWIAWGNCKISHKDIAERLTEQLRQEGNNIRTPLTENNIKGYLFEVREKIKERVLKASNQWDWLNTIKRYKNCD
jgi:hypothetical protein